MLIIFFAAMYLWEASNGKFSIMCEIWEIDLTWKNCAKVKRVTPRLGRDFMCGRCKKQGDGLVELVEELCFCYFLGIG